MKWMKQFVDEDRETEVTEKEVIERLSGFYTEPENLIKELPVGQKIRTFWAYFWKEE